MRKLLVLPVLFFSLALAAQTRFGVKAGISHANVYAESDRTKHFIKGRTSALAGISVELFATPRFSIQPELNYSYQVASETFNYSRLTYSYIQLPVFAKFYITDSAFSFYVGPQLGFLLDASLHYQQQKTDMKQQLQQTDFGAAAGIGYRSKKRFTLDVRAYHGAMNVYKSEFDAGIRSRNIVFTFAAGYQFGRK